MKKINEIKEKIKNTKIKNEKKKGAKKKKTTKTIILSTILIGAISLVTIFLIFALYIIITAPDFDKTLLYNKEATVIYDVNGNELVRTGESNSELVSYDELPQVLIDAIVATEDSRFFQHTGLDAPRFVMASFGQLLGNEDAGGASTLSMQVIKNTYTSTDASGLSGLIRKFTDIYMSIFKLENAFTKEEILEFYVNSQWLGYDFNLNYTGITGVQQGSQYFFGKDVSELTLAEASLLAGMFQNPRTLNPYEYPENSRNRQETVLNLMIRHGYITEEEKDAVLAIPIESLLKEENISTAGEYQAAIDYILNEAQEVTKTEDNPEGLNPYYTPMKIYSTIDPEVQDILVDVENKESYAPPEERGPIQFGVAITNIEDGSITALSGGYDYQPKGTNRADEKRQPGSTAKPIFDYGPYIEYLNGSPGTVFIDEPHTYTNGGSVRNYDNQFEGLITMRDALVDSRNIPALKAFQEVAAVDITLIQDFVHNLGIDYGDTLYESASIGGFDGTSPLELSAAYAAFGRGGIYIEPYSITKITFIESDTTVEYKYTEVKAMSEQTAYMITDMLVSAGDDYVAGFRVSGTDLAAKTGTTTIDEEYTDANDLPSNATMDSWIVSYNPEYSSATWVGYDSLKEGPNYYLTSSRAAPVRNGISKAVGTELYSKNQTFDKPSGVSSVEIEKETIPLQLPSPYTPESMISTELFKSGTEPTDISWRYAELANITEANGIYDGTNINLTWTPIAAPSAIDQSFLVNYYNEYFGDYASKYYEQRVSYNSSIIGTLTYDIYLNTNGTVTYLGSTASPTFTYTVPTAGETYNFIIKSAYTKFKTNASTGVNVSVQTTIDTNTGDIVLP